ncbi:MAG: AAA family ATPase [Candidatus Methylomirabilia bacterium]
MRCPACQFENPPAMRFCGQCGSALALSCPQCGAEVPGGFRFCGQCGASLQGSPAPASKPPVAADYQPRLASYTPKHLADKILKGRSALEGERRQVTVLFADVAGFAALAEKLDPEEVHRIIERCFELITAEVHRFEGTINQYTGDGVMALFGAPVAHEDSPRRAVHAALGIQRALRDYSTELQAERGLALQMRMGLNTGPVVVGRIGDDLRMDYTAVGDTTNLAARLQQIARPGSVLVGEATHKMITGFFETLDLGEVSLKGHAPARAFEVLRGRGRRARLDVAAERGLTPLVGQQRELSTLLDLFREVKAGRGQVVFITGEAGIGKSRLVLEFRRALAQAGEEVTWLDGRCISFGQSIPFLPIIDQLRENFQIEEVDGEPEIIAKIEHGMRRLGELEPHIPYIRSLLAVDPGDPEVSAMAAPARRRKMFDACRALALRGAKLKPLVFVFEDLHWVDTSTVEYLSSLMDSAAGAPLMLILTYRVGYTPPFGSRSFHTTLTLHSLSEVESLTMAGHILGSGRFPEELKTALVDRAEGVPLFVEEVTKTLLDLGILRRDNGGYRMVKGSGEVSVPDTIQGIIMARLDRLGEDGKRTVQLASVIGRQFLQRLLERITGLTDQLEGLLAELKALEIIYEQGLLPEPAYVFKHAVIQDVAYNSLLRERRKEVHRAVGHAIEELYADRLEEHYGELTHHYFHGQVWDKAFEFAAKAADKAKAIFANREAIHFYTQALEASAKVSPPAERAVLMAIYESRGTVWHLLSNYDAAVADFEAMQGLAQQLRDRVKEGEALCNQAASHWFRFSEAYKGLVEKCASEAMVIAEETGNELLLARALSSLGMVDQKVGMLHQADGKFLGSVEICRRGGFKGPLVTNLVWLGAHANWRGEFLRAIEYEREAERVAQEVHDGFFELVAYCFRCNAHAALGEWVLAFQALDDAMRKGRERENKYAIARGTNTLGWVHSELGDFRRAAEFNREGIELGRAANISNNEINAVINLADNHLSLGEVGPARRILRETAERLKTGFFDAHLWRWNIRVALAFARAAFLERDLDGALAPLEESLRLAEKTESRKYVAEARGLRGELRLAAGQPKEAIEELRGALTLAEAISCPTQIWRLSHQLGRALGGDRQLNQAREALARALDVVEATASRVPERLRPAFLASTQVAALKEEFAQLGRIGA